jgi:hypothetical protein
MTKELGRNAAAEIYIPQLDTIAPQRSSPMFKPTFDMTDLMK